jgi:hypothetical protein
LIGLLRCITYSRNFLWEETTNPFSRQGASKGEEYIKPTGTTDLELHSTAQFLRTSIHNAPANSPPESIKSKHPNNILLISKLNNQTFSMSSSLPYNNAIFSGPLERIDTDGSGNFKHICADKPRMQTGVSGSI